MIVPDEASTVLLLRDNPDGFQVLMVERNSRGFFGSIVVFPGGGVDGIDLDGAFEEDVAPRRTAIRELAEEAGILLTTAGAMVAPDVKDGAFYDWVVDHEIELAIDSLVLVSRWVTPEIAPRRFDTRFYLATGDGLPEVVLDTDELVGYGWVTPKEALRRHAANEWKMILPTLAHLRWLERRSTIEDAMQSARGADGRTLIRPQVMDDGSILPIHLPADAH